ncbi:hypothetical protein FPSE_07419 [Fusarium pseudograminearum CS3096]|uniref:Uncharacterized protein n=1 Tax=Fusarium pseudograminearum (strain CS3096) TaxID=1028729 RepID=K3VZH2_FUSPC|nr:hypothetical protein FPSE_07419 [Fusarium pseudograminearum CS3096]EKJ72395.1 hypothetical protein FPSE_07419 [Fusarium pseudograminearum CS3096]
MEASAAQDDARRAAKAAAAAAKEAATDNQLNDKPRRRGRRSSQSLKVPVTPFKSTLCLRINDPTVPDKFAQVYGAIPVDDMGLNKQGRQTTYAKKYINSGCLHKLQCAGYTKGKFSLEPDAKLAAISPTHRAFWD